MATPQRGRAQQVLPLHVRFRG